MRLPSLGTVGRGNEQVDALTRDDKIVSRFERSELGRYPIPRFTAHEDGVMRTQRRRSTSGD